MVTLYKLIHGHTLGEIACKADIGWSTVHDILWMVIPATIEHWAILYHGHKGRGWIWSHWLSKVDQWLSICIGASDGSHRVIWAPCDTIIVTDHQNRMKTSSMLLQGVNDFNCYFTSINTRVPGSMHESYHLKCSELYPEAEVGNMTGLNQDPYMHCRWPWLSPHKMFDNIVQDECFGCSSHIRGAMIQS